MVAIKNLAAKLAALSLITRQNTPCLFVMNVVGNLPSTWVIETHTGENRGGDGFQQGEYYMAGQALYDDLEHRCMIEPTTQQFRCGTALDGLLEFSVADNGNLMHQSSENFLACPDSIPGSGWVISSDALKNTSGCEPITLRTEGYSCTALGRLENTTSTSATSSSTTNLGGYSSSPTSVTSVPTSSPSVAPTNTVSTPVVSPFLPSTTTPATACPTDISGGTFQYPHLIVPTSSKDGDHAFGNSDEAYITPINTTLFNFDIPSTYTGTCALVFLFPYGSDLDASAGKYTFSGTEQEVGGHGGIDFALLSGIATSATTFNNTPSVQTDYGKTQIIPGNNYTIATYPCQAGKTVSYSATSVGNVELDYFQDSAPMPIGLYIVPCGAST